MRLSDADRERLYELLSQHAAAGRITMEELERRVAVAARAQTREEATALLDALPPLPGQSETPKRIMRVWVDAHGGRHYLNDHPA